MLPYFRRIRRKQDFIPKYKVINLEHVYYKAWSQCCHPIYHQTIYIYTYKFYNKTTGLVENINKLKIVSVNFVFMVFVCVCLHSLHFELVWTAVLYLTTYGPVLHTIHLLNYPSLWRSTPPLPPLFRQMQIHQYPEVFLGDELITWFL